MPKIKPYDIQTQAANVPDVQRASPAQFGAAGAGLQSIADAGLQIADIVRKRQEQQEVSDIHVNLSKTQAAWTTRYQKELQEGTLNTETFTKELDDAMGEQEDNISTRAGKQYFNQSSAELKAHFLEKTALGEAQLAGKKAVANYEQSLNANSSTLINDPSSFKMINGMQQEGIKNLVATHQLPAEKAEELYGKSQTELAKSAVRGWIKLNPDDAKEQLDGGKWDAFIDGDIKHALLSESDQAIRARQVEDERLQKKQKEIIAQQQVETQNVFLQKMAGDGLTTKDILESNLEPFGSGSKEQFIKLLQQNNQEKIKTDSPTYISLWDRVHLPDGDPNKIVDENYLNQFMGRGLTVQDINALRGEIQGKKTIAGSDEADLKKGLTDIAKGKLTKSNPLTGLRDPVGDEQYQKFLSGFLVDYRKQREAGKSAQQLLSPDSADYLGKNINQYVRTQTQIIQDMVKINKSGPTPTATPAEPRKAGESPSDYLKRLGK